MADSTGGGGASSPQLSPIVIGAIFFVILLIVFIILSTWHESASLVHGFIITALVLVALGASGVISTDLSKGINALNFLAGQHKL